VRYPVAIEPGTDETAFGVVVPDLPGFFSAGDTLDEAMAGAEEAAAAWIDAALDAGQGIPFADKPGCHPPESRLCRMDVGRYHA
jgi:predicted RNase H-like HicB family nuclease